MPHVTVEYTANLGADARIPELLAAINRAMLAQRHEGKPVYPIGGLRTRAVRLEEYLIADGAADDAFVHVTVRAGAGRPDAVERAAGDAVFAALSAHYDALFATRTLALSLDMQRFSEAGTWKRNNIHARYKGPQASQGSQPALPPVPAA